MSNSIIALPYMRDKTLNKVKSSNIEILRIIAMLMIIAHHYCVHGIFNYWHTNSTLTDYFNNVIVGIVAMGGKLGVDIFVLITGYFMIVSDCKFTKVVKLYLTTLLYSLLLLVIAYIYGEHHVPSRILNSSLFPFGGNAYWFITTYLMLYIFVPYLNKFILTSKKTMLNSLMVVTTLLWVLIPTFTPASYCFSSLVWFIYLYFIGASIRLKSYASVFNNKQFFKNLFIVSCIVLVVYAFVRCIGTDVNLWGVTKLARMQTIFIVSIAIYLFHYFKDLEIHYNKFINQIAVSVFGVYLLHDNNIVRPFLWRVIVQPCNYMDKPYMVLYLLAVVFIVFILGIVIDKLVMSIAQKYIDKIVDLLSHVNKFKRKACYKFIIKSIHRLNRTRHIVYNK